MRTAIGAAVACLSIVGAVAAGDVRASIKRQTDIPAQSLGSALQKLAHDREFQIVYRAELESLPTKGASGELTLDQALQQLLKDSGQSFRYVDDRTVTILPMSVEKEVSQNAVLPGAQLAMPLDAQQLMSRLAQSNQVEGGGDYASSGEGSSESSKLEEIVVTAQKRKENLQEVPISISVVSGAELDKSSAQGITETLTRIPAVAASEGIQGGGTQITIRGVSNGAALVAGASTSAYYIDSVPFGFVRNAVAPDPAAYDLERLEVLRGPQGTLYGANALNGVVRILTHEADLDTFELKVRTSTSTTDDGGENYRGDVAVNVPIVDDKLAVRAVLGYNDLSGWVDAPNRGKDDINDAQLANARIKIKARPTENLTISLSAWASRNDYGAASVSNDNRTVSSLYEESNSTDFTTYGLDIGYDFAAFSLSSATSYIDYSNGGDLGGLLFTGMDSRVLAQEVLLSSTDEGAWQWSLGAFYRDAEDEWFQDAYGVLEGAAVANFIDTSESYALFGEVSHRFFHDRLKWTLGLRYFHDEGTTEGFVFDPGHIYSATYQATTPRAVLTWTPSTDLSIYGSYSQGFRSGAYQYEAATALVPFYPPVEPDTLNNYEIGAKGSFLDQRVSFEVAVFYIDWRDVQQVLNVQAGTLPNGEPYGFNVAINGSSASGLGAEFALTVRPTQGLELGASLSWNDLTMDKAVFSFGGNNLPIRVFAAGDRLGFSPEYTASVFADYAFPIGSGFKGRLSGSVNYTSPQDSFGGTTRFFGDDITIARASFSLEAADHWTAMLYVDNFNNESDNIVPQYGNPDWQPRPRPRTAGLQLEYRW